MALKPLIAGMSQASTAGAGGAPSGAAGGGLGGTYPNPSVKAQSPAWTYTSGSIGSGLFTTDNATITGTTVLTFSGSVAGAWSEGRAIVPVTNTRILLIDSNELVSAFIVNDSPNDDSGNLRFPVTPLFSAGTMWAGRYTLAFVPVAQLGNVINELQLKASDLDTDGTLNANSDSKIASQKATKTYVDSLGIVLDSGWTPNADAGDKGVVIPGVTTIATNVATAVAGLDPTGTLGLNAALGHLQSVAEKVKAIEYTLSIQKRPNA